MSGKMGNGIASFGGGIDVRRVRDVPCPEFDPTTCLAHDGVHEPAIVATVENADLVPVGYETPRDPSAEEAGAAGDQDLHAFLPLGRCFSGRLRALTVDAEELEDHRDDQRSVAVPDSLFGEVDVEDRLEGGTIGDPKHAQRADEGVHVDGLHVISE